jgi:hypothetical protein
MTGTELFLTISLVGLAFIIPAIIGSIGLDVLDLGMGQGDLTMVFVGLGSGAAIGGASALIALHTFHTSMTAAWFTFFLIAVTLAVLVFMVGMNLKKASSGAGDAITLDSLKGHEYPLRHSVKEGSLGELYIDDCSSVPFTVWFRAKESASAGATVRVLGASQESPKQVEAEIVHDTYTVFIPTVNTVKHTSSDQCHLGYSSHGDVNACKTIENK